MCSGVYFMVYGTMHLRMAKQYLVDDSIILDIGANFGGFSLRLATHAAKGNYQNVQIHAFEPNPAIFKRYRDNLALNPSLANLVTFTRSDLAVSQVNNFLKLKLVNTGAGRVIERRVHKGSRR